MNGRLNQIGFSQRIRLEWLEQTANYVLACNDKDVINKSLQKLLKDKVSIGGNAQRGNREKIITILIKIWLNVPEYLKPFRDDGLKFLKKLPKKQKVAIHWGMSMAVYPFWATIAYQTGRLLKLQGSASAAQIQRRIREQYGERETVSRAARRVLRSFVDWEILQETKNKGVYKQGLKLEIDSFELVTWLVEASLYSRSNESAGIQELIDSPGIFPFILPYLKGEKLTAISPRLELLYHGMDETLIMLKK